LREPTNLITSYGTLARTGAERYYDIQEIKKHFKNCIPKELRKAKRKELLALLIDEQEDVKQPFEFMESKGIFAEFMRKQTTVSKINFKLN
jgi:hypothetical protein